MTKTGSSRQFVISCPIPAGADVAKRAFDVLVASTLLVILALPMLALAIWIRLDSPGPALFRQERVGMNGRTFHIHKFRTMRVEQQGSALTAAGDQRITRVGRWIRERRLDEWPQLIDVLCGQMSLVGPRPEVPQYVALYPQELRELILSVRPGITDPAALAFRDEGRILALSSEPERTYVEEVLPAKLRLQADYLQRASLVSDLQVLWSTLSVVWGRAQSSRLP